MPHTTTKGKNVYSVDMMFAYINLFGGPDVVDVKLEDIGFDPNNKGWGEMDTSVNDVLKNPRKYSKDYAEILKADLKYPILLDSRYGILDGVHRYVKALGLGKKTIKAQIFDKKLLSKFIINKKGDHTQDIKIHEYIEMFHKRFLRRNYPRR